MAPQTTHCADHYQISQHAVKPSSNFACVTPFAPCIRFRLTIRSRALRHPWTRLNAAEAEMLELGQHEKSSAPYPEEM